MPLFECRLELDATIVPRVESALDEFGDVAWSLFEDVLAQRAWVIGIFPDAAQARRGWKELRRHLPRRGRGRSAFRELPDTDWRESYKAHFKAWRCGRLHWVPEWERATHRLGPSDVAVYLDPGLAFGTGNHETTRLCCRRLVEYARALSPRQRRTWRVIDAGCGSGILAISAARLGCRHVFAFDNDAEAVGVARKNVRRNHVSSFVRHATGGIGPMLARRRADLVLANIQSDVLIRHVADLLRAVAPDGRLILSGILASELDTVRDVFNSQAMGRWRATSRRQGEWADLSFRRMRIP